MTDNVVSISGCVPACMKNEEAIEMVERLLQRLKSGEDVGIAYVAVRPNGTSTHGWNCPSGMGNDLFAGISRLQFTMISESQ